MNIDNYKEAYINAVYKTGAFLIKDQPFILRSGKTSHLYLNHRQFLTQATYLENIAKAYSAKIKSVLDNFTLAVVDSIMSPIIAGAISMRMNADIVVVKSKKLQHGTKEDIYGSLKKKLLSLMI